jgi:hypothetical protein
MKSKSPKKSVFLNGIRVRYNHPAVPPDGINMIDTYIIYEDWRGVYLTNGNKIFDIPYEKIKILFHPINLSWYEIERGIQ